MFPRSASTARGTAAASAPHPASEPAAQSGTDWNSVFGEAERACCCSARPTVVAVFPPRLGRSRGVDLLLCGHHYRACRASLARAGAVVHDLPPR